LGENKYLILCRTSKDESFKYHSTFSLNMYEEQLKELGLTNNEIQIYLLLLKEGTLNPTKIAEKLGLHRGYIYDALERLREKQIVNSVLKDDKKHFQANSPENVAELLEFRLRNFKDIIPNLIQLMDFKKEDTFVELHKGRRVYRTLIKDIIATVKDNDEVLLVGVDEQNLIDNVEPIYLKQYFNIIASRNIKERVIMKNEKKVHKIPYVTHKKLDSQYIGNTEQVIYGDKVAIFILGNPYHLIVINNKEVSNTYRKQFDLLWKTAKKV